MQKKTKNTLQYLFWAAVAVVLVYFCFRSIDWAQFMEALEHCQWEWVLLSVALGILSLFIRGLRWNMLLVPMDPKTSVLTCFNAYNIGSAVNLFLPRVGLYHNLHPGVDGRLSKTPPKTRKGNVFCRPIRPWAPL